jgi:hypothetical protein
VIPDIVMALNVNANSSTTSFNAILDAATLSSQIGNTANRTFSADYLVQDATLGHGSTTLPPGFFGYFDFNQPAPATFYLFGPNQLVLIGTLSGRNSDVAFFETN